VTESTCYRHHCCEPSQPLDTNTVAAHQHWINQLLAHLHGDEVPIAAAIIDGNNQLIAQAGNTVISSHDPTAHAEINVIRQAALSLGNYRLTGCRLYVTLEPCLMCLAAIIQARISEVIFAAADQKLGLLSQRMYQSVHHSWNHHIHWTGNISATVAEQQLRSFFIQRR